MLYPGVHQDAPISPVLGHIAPHFVVIFLLIHLLVLLVIQPLPCKLEKMALPESIVFSRYDTPRELMGSIPPKPMVSL